MDLDDPSDVAIVTCTDGTTLLRASASKVLLRHLGKREADDDNDDNDSSKQRELKAGADKGRKRKVATSKATSSKATSSKATSSKANTSKATSSEASTSKATRDRGEKRKAPLHVDSERPTKRHGAQVSEPTDEEQRDGIECCYMWGGKVSKSFWVEELSSYEGEPSRVQNHTYFYSKNHNEWRVCPKGFEPLLSAEQEAYCEVYRMNLGLVNDRSL